MSTYYDYREVGVMIAHKLMKMEGWKVYGYHADQSDRIVSLQIHQIFWKFINNRKEVIL